MDWLELLAVQGTLKSLLQHRSSKASILGRSAFFRVQLSHPYMIIGKTIALTRQTFVGKVMSLFFNMLSRLVIAFLPRSKRLLISWLQSQSAVILEPKVCHCFLHEYKERILDKKTELEVVKEKMSVRNEDLKAKQEELATIIESTAVEEEKLSKERAACAAKIDARTMSAYDRIRKSNNNHLAVVSVFNGDSCGGCFNTIAPQRLIDIAANKKLIICEYCGRILVNPDFE